MKHRGTTKWTRCWQWSTMIRQPYLDQGARSWWHESRVGQICPAPRGIGSRDTRRDTRAVPRRGGSLARGRARDRSRAAARRASRPRTPRPSPHSPPPWRARAAIIGPPALRHTIFCSGIHRHRHFRHYFTSFKSYALLIHWYVLRILNCWIIVQNLK